MMKLDKMKFWIARLIYKVGMYGTICLCSI